jgi:hypothetical protein
LLALPQPATHSTVVTHQQIIFMRNFQDAERLAR